MFLPDKGIYLGEDDRVWQSDSFKIIFVRAEARSKHLEISQDPSNR